MSDILNFINNTKPVLTLNGKEYKVNKSYKISLYFAAKQKEIEKAKKENPDFNEVEANFDLVFETFEKTVSKEFQKEVEALELNENELITLFNVVNYMRGGMTQEEAIKKVQEDKEKEDQEEKKA